MNLLQLARLAVPLAKEGFRKYQEKDKVVASIPKLFTNNTFQDHEPLSRMVPMPPV